MVNLEPVQRRATWISYERWLYLKVYPVSYQRPREFNFYLGHSSWWYVAETKINVPNAWLHFEAWPPADISKAGIYEPSSLYRLCRDATTLRNSLASVMVENHKETGFKRRPGEHLVEAKETHGCLSKMPWRVFCDEVRIGGGSFCLLITKMEKIHLHSPARHFFASGWAYQPISLSYG